MKKKLKIQIDDMTAAENLIVSKGGKFLDKTRNKFTYFNQPEGKILKLINNEKGLFLMQSQKEGNGFVVLKEEKVNGHSDIAEKLKIKFGVTKKIQNQQWKYVYKNFLITLTQIKNGSCFLTLQGDDPTLKILSEIGFSNPRIITEAFDNL